MDAKCNKQLDRIEAKINDLIKKENKMGATLDQVLQDVTDESTVADSIITLLQGIQQQLKDALNNVTIRPADQVKIDAIFSGIEANKAKISTAVTANTPAEK